MFEGTEVAIALECEVCQEKACIKGFGRQVANAVAPVLVFMAVKQRVGEKVANFLGSAAATILILLPFD